MTSVYDGDDPTEDATQNRAIPKWRTVDI